VGGRRKRPRLPFRVYVYLSHLAGDGACPVRCIVPPLTIACAVVRVHSPWMQPKRSCTGSCPTAGTRSCSCWQTSATCRTQCRVCGPPPGSFTYHLASAHAPTWPYGQSRRSRRAWTWLVWAIPTFCTSARQQPAWVGLSLGIARVAPGTDRYSSFPGVTEALHMLASQLNKIASTAPEKGSVLVD